MNIRYANFEEAWGSYDTFLQTLIERTGAKRVLEVGGGANPALPLDFVLRQGLEYTILDISLDELGKAPNDYMKVQGDISSPSLDLPERDYDLVFSKMLAEHIQNGETFHRNVYRLLGSSGRAFHFFPTLYAPPFMFNRLLPERLAEQVLNLLQSGREESGKNKKFPAYYSWCRGPTRKQMRRFSGLGYQVEEYIGFFGHDPYYSKFPLLLRLHRTLSKWLERHPIPLLCSFTYVILRKTT
jgi:SAM-dependent methyltransferase